MRKVNLLFSFLFLMLFVLQFSIQAKPPKPKRTDKNKDGVVGKYEQDMAKKKAANVNTWWEKQADVNKDGKVDANELSVWKTQQKQRDDLDGDGVISPKENRLSWRHGASKVNTSLEKQYDADGDGFLNPSEAKEYLNAKYNLVKTNGKAKVDSPLEKEYDADKNGVIDAQEAEALQEDLQ